MKSKSFSRSKQLRYPNSLRKDLKFIKKSRIRNDRRSIRQILKFDPNRENLPQTIRINNGTWQIIWTFRQIKF